VRPVLPVRILAHVIEEVLAEAVERHALHEARRDDAVGVDVIAGNIHGAAGNGGDFGGKSHGRRAIRD
jgi:hypothetical protein